MVPAPHDDSGRRQLARRQLNPLPGLCVVACAFAAMACNGDDGSGTSPTEDTGITYPDPTYEYDAVITEKQLVGGLTDDAVAAHQMSNMFLASAALVASDEKVGDQLNTDGEGPGFTPTGDFECWERPQFPMWSFDISYEPCTDQFDLAGGVTIEDHPSGPLLFNYNSFTVAGRVLGGTLAFDTTDAFDSPMYWQTYNTDATTPSPDNDVQLGIETDGFTSGASWAGGTQVDLQGRTMQMWGVLTLRPGARDFTIVHGGAEEDDVPADEAAPAEAVTNSLVWQTCRCPTSGQSTYDLDIDYSEITFDLDSIEVVDDGFDDPDITVEVEHTVGAKATLTYTGCGEYDLDFEGEATSFTVPNAAVSAYLSYLCEIAVIPSDRCLGVVQGATDAGDFTVEVTRDEVLAVAQAAVEAEFDQGWCLTTQ